MSAHRFFLAARLPESAQGEQTLLPLTDGDVHHSVAVLRIGADSEITVVEPDGRAWRARVCAANRQGVWADTFERVEGVRGCNVTLIQGVAKGDKVDLVVEKVTEIGASAIVPVLTERSVVRLTPEKAAARGERWRRVATAAAKQSQRTSVPIVFDPVPLTEFLADRYDLFDAVLVVWEGASATGPGIGEALDEFGVNADSHIALVVGPEGGFTAKEVYELESGGARAVTLGETVLRSETAGIAAVAVCIYEMGGLGGRDRA